MSVPNLAPIQPAPLAQSERISAADQIFDALHVQILTMELAPGTRLSETEVGQQFAVSRQPVRDAFFRLAQLGFLVIRPQRATIVSPISIEAVMQARFVRASLELETTRIACEVMGNGDHAALRGLLAQQKAAMEAGDKVEFHRLDDAFHREICERAGVGFVWDVVRVNKAHIDRVRFLSLSFASARTFAEHERIMDAIEARDAPTATAEMRQHLSQIRSLIGRIRDENAEMFVPGEPVPEIL
ncbi:MAG: GntR family transcriptional regulator [Paracoccus sp. (in: a-proteobacteria)]|nr:GntR family transcriptional regulator [Paracoccus sp. (in: a-proteobacteria)]